MYGEFENKQLQNAQEYIIFVLAVLEMSDNVRQIYASYFAYHNVMEFCYPLPPHFGGKY